MVAAFAAATTLFAFTSHSNNNIHHSRMAPQQRKRLKLSASSLSSSSDVTTLRLFPVDQHAVQLSPEEAAKELRGLTAAMNGRHGQPFTTAELDGVVHSLQNVVPAECDVDWDDLKRLLKEVAHLSHKDWSVTQDNAAKLDKILLPAGTIDNDNARQMLERILREGNWDGAAAHASNLSPDDKPWAVLVTGVNGIRKTTSMYQSWFPQLLREALQAPPDGETKPAVVPDGSNSFFRQLDHMIATLCNEDFATLYRLTRDCLPENKNSNNEKPPSKEIIQQYSDLKAAIFTRYRTLSELLGAVLLMEAQKSKLNCMLETSGRDVAMFHYVDHFFPNHYHKLALHFTINDIDYAKTSVDRRMVHEIEAGVAAVAQQDVYAVINSNAGGPYGSEVLEGVQADSDRVWETQVLSGKVGQDWYKATIRINAHATEPWTAQAVKPDGSLGTEFAFALRK